MKRLSGEDLTECICLLGAHPGFRNIPVRMQIAARAFRQKYPGQYRRFSHQLPYDGDEDESGTLNYLNNVALPDGNSAAIVYLNSFALELEEENACRKSLLAIIRKYEPVLKA